MKIICPWCLKDFFGYAVDCAMVAEQKKSEGLHNSGTISAIDRCPKCSKYISFIAVYNAAKCYDTEISRVEVKE